MNTEINNINNNVSNLSVTDKWKNFLKESYDSSFEVVFNTVKLLPEDVLKLSVTGKEAYINTLLTTKGSLTGTEKSIFLFTLQNIFKCFEVTEPINITKNSNNNNNYVDLPIYNTGSIITQFLLDYYNWLTLGSNLNLKWHVPIINCFSGHLAKEVSKYINENPTATYLAFSTFVINQVCYVSEKEVFNYLITHSINRDNSMLFYFEPEQYVATMQYLFALLPTLPNLFKVHFLLRFCNHPIIDKMVDAKGLENVFKMELEEALKLIIQFKSEFEPRKRVEPRIEEEPVKTTEEPPVKKVKTDPEKKKVYYEPGSCKNHPNATSHTTEQCRGVGKSKEVVNTTNTKVEKKVFKKPINKTSFNKYLPVNNKNITKN